MFIKLNLFFIFISTAIIFRSSYSVIVEESITTVALTYAISLVVVLCQFLILLKLESIKRETILGFKKNSSIILFISAALTINFLFYIFTLINYFTAQLFYYKIIFLVIFFSFSFLFLKTITKNNFLITFFIVFFIAFNFYNLLQITRSLNEQYFSVKNINHDNNKINKDFDKIIKYAKFKNKPDIHIFIYDALIPNYITNKYLGIKETAYYKLLKKKNAIIFKNSFVDFPSTPNTLNSLFYLNPQEYRKLDDKKNFFNGINDSPLVSLFHYNDYKVAVSWQWQKIKRGYFVDKDIGRTNSLTIPRYCNLAGRIYKVRFFPMCLITDYFVSTNINSLKNIKSLNEDNQPWLSMNFINYPSHMVHGQSIDKYKNVFLKRQEDVKNFIELTIKQFNNKNKDSILIVLGDHGMLQTNVCCDPLNPFDYKADLNFFIEDQYINFISLLDEKNLCSNVFSDDKYNFATPIFVMENLLKCLTNENEIIVKKNDYSIFYLIDEEYTKVETQLNKLDFLYEN